MQQLRFSVTSMSMLLLGLAASAQVTERVSIASDGTQGNHDSSDFGHSSNCADSRYVAFSSVASNLVPGDTNGVRDVFVRDRQSGTTERVSLAVGGAQGNGNSYIYSISPDGRYLTFGSYATNIVLGDTNGAFDDFLLDRQTGAIERVSVGSGGTEGNGDGGSASTTPDARFVAFTSSAANLVPGDTNGNSDVFVLDRQSGITERVSVSSGAAQASSYSERPSISADGRYVAFRSNASNLVPGDTNGFPDIFVKDRQDGLTERVSLSSSGVQGNGLTNTAAISADGRYVAFYSFATNLVLGDTNGNYDIFVRDRQSGTTERVSLDSNGTEGNSQSLNASISADGRYVSFQSASTNLVPGDTNGWSDVFVRDRQSGTTERVSVDSNGMQANDHIAAGSPISANGRYVMFATQATNLVLGDTNGFADIFVRDREATGFVSLCDPGIAGVSGCPCSNPPSGPGLGCDNSSATGGASLSASGVGYLSMDSLVFTTSGEKPTATSIVLQGNAQNASGLVFGQGVRCAVGMLLRLYLKTASAGSITAPDFGAGDPTVSARSNALGDMIQAGESRWYLVYYRDPVVLGGCPAGSTFNATQTGRVNWSL